MGLRILEEEVEMDRTRRIFLVVAEGIGEGDKIIMTTIVAMVTEITIAKVEVGLATMIATDHPNAAIMA